MAGRRSGRKASRPRHLRRKRPATTSGCCAARDSDPRTPRRRFCRTTKQGSKDRDAQEGTGSGFSRRAAPLPDLLMEDDMAKGKRHRTIDPAKAGVASGGDPNWYRDIIVRTERKGAACIDCGVRIGAVALQGRCVRCHATIRREQIERRAATGATE